MSTAKPPPDATIRPAVVADAHAVADVHARSWPVRTA